MSKELAQLVRQAWTCDQQIPPLALWSEPDWRTLWEAREHLVIRALNAAKERGNSYRNFQVGAAAFTTSKYPDILRTLGRTPQHIFTGSNWKTGEETRNTCAEQEIASQIRQQEHLFYPDKVLALAVAGNPLNEPDRESGLVTKALHPCNHCRRLLGELPYFTDHTILILVNLDNTHQEIFLFEEILRQHERPEN